MEGTFHTGMVAVGDNSEVLQKCQSLFLTSMRQKFDTKTHLKKGPLYPFVKLSHLNIWPFHGSQIISKNFSLSYKIRANQVSHTNKNENLPINIFT